MQHAIDLARNPGQVRCDPAADEKRDQARNRPPDTGADAERLAARRFACKRIDGAHADAGSEHAERQLNDDRQDDAGENGGPRNALDRRGWVTARVSIVLVLVTMMKPPLD